MKKLFLSLLLLMPSFAIAQVVGSNSSEATLANGATYTGEWQPAGEHNSISVKVVTDQPGKLQIDFSSDCSTEKNDLDYEVAANIPEVHALTILSECFRVYFLNDSGSAQTSFDLQTRFLDSSLLVAPKNLPISLDSDAITVRNIDAGADIANGLRSGVSTTTKFGRNPDVDTGGEDVWFGGGDYTGQNATQNEEIDVVSTDVNDVGTDVTTGSATGGSATTIVASGDTFITDGVAVGDFLVNETKGGHGYISSVDSETQLTVYDMHSSDVNANITNESGDSYRVVRAADTGGGLIQISQIMNSAWEPQPDVYLTLNGTNTVTTSGVDAFRAYRVKIIAAGSSGWNEGTITVNQATTHANVFATVEAERGQTQIAAFSVPYNRHALLKRIHIQITRANGSAGSAVVEAMNRPVGQAWTSKVYDLATDAGRDYENYAGEILQERTDFKFRVVSVSDTNTAVNAEVEYQLYDY